MFKLLPALVAVIAPIIHAAPVPLFGIHLGSGDTTDGTPTALAQSTVNSDLVRPAQFARAAYCSPASVTGLTCGAACDAIKTVKVLVAGGDEGEIPRCEFASLQHV